MWEFPSQEFGVMIMRKDGEFAGRPPMFGRPDFELIGTGFQYSILEKESGCCCTQARGEDKQP